mgnify:CR=1 FL=1
MSKVKANDTVKVHYTGKLSNGQVFDSSDIVIDANHPLAGHDLIFDLQLVEIK